MAHHLNRNWIQNIIFVILCLAVFFGIRYSLMPVIVIGQSMENTYENHDFLIGSRLSYKNSSPVKGDVVVIDGIPYDLDVTIIKRVIATEGDTVKVKNGYVYVNDRKIDEPYIAEKPNFDFDKIVVKDNEVFVMGDNRNHSIDSRVFGCVSIDDIQSKIIIDSPIIAKMGHILDWFKK